MTELSKTDSSWKCWHLSRRKRLALASSSGRLLSRRFARGRRKEGKRSKVRREVPSALSCAHPELRAEIQNHSTPRTRHTPQSSPLPSAFPGMTALDSHSNSLEDLQLIPISQRRTRRSGATDRTVPNSHTWETLGSPGDSLPPAVSGPQPC